MTEKKVMNWSKDIVENIDKEIFHPGIKVLCRPSDEFLIEKIRQALEKKPRLKILDFACGTGRLLTLLKKFGIDFKPGNYFGYDTSPAMLAKAMDRYPAYTFDNKFPEKEFDLVICIDMIQHNYTIDDMKAHIKKMMQVSDNVILHFWAAAEDKLKEIETCGEKFAEFFLSADTVKNNLLLMYKIEDLVIFPGQNPRYDADCAVAVIENETKRIRNEAFLTEEQEAISFNIAENFNEEENTAGLLELVTHYDENKQVAHPETEQKGAPDNTDSEDEQQ